MPLHNQIKGETRYVIIFIMENAFTEMKSVVVPYNLNNKQKKIDVELSHAEKYITRIV